MKDPKEVYREILEEHLHDIQMNDITSWHNVYQDGWFNSRLHVLELIGFKPEEIDTAFKIVVILDKYKEEIEVWNQKLKEKKK